MASGDPNVPAPPRISLCALLTREDWWRSTAATVLVRHLDLVLGPIGNAWRTIQGHPHCHVRWSTQMTSLIIVIHRLLTVMFLDLSLCLSCLSTTDRCWRLTASHQFCPRAFLVDPRFFWLSRFLADLCQLCPFLSVLKVFTLGGRSFIASLTRSSLSTSSL